MSGFYWHPQDRYNIDTIYSNVYGTHIYWCAVGYTGTVPNLGGNQILLLAFCCGGANYQAQYAISFGGVKVAMRSITNGDMGSLEISHFHLIGI